MTLSVKLTLAFVLVSLAAIGLAAIFVQNVTSSQFNDYLLEQQREQFVRIATDHYTQTGGWKGVELPLRAANLLPPPPSAGDALLPQPFALTDARGRVIIPGGGFVRGQNIQPNLLEKGIAIDVENAVIGYVLTTNTPPLQRAVELQYLQRVNQSLLIAAGGGTLVALALGFLLARSLTRPLRELTGATNALAAGKFEQQVPVRSADELGQLARSFNQMSADLSRAQQARKQMTADIAHDLRNPLTVIGGYLESLKDGKLQPTPERFATMQAEVFHLENLVDDLRTLSLADSGELKLQPRSVSVSELLAQTVEAYRRQADEQGVLLKSRVEANLENIPIDPQRIEQVLGNLVSNALRYTPKDGEIELSAACQGAGLLLQVRDTGSGIVPESLPHIFECSYRSDPSRSGDESGLGLAIAKSLIELHGGTITVESQPGQGSRFVIWLPINGG